VYTVIEKIGSGGSSEVFRVLDESNVMKAIKQVSCLLLLFCHSNRKAAIIFIPQSETSF
jgi:serine/threonine protein kinase